MFEFKSLILEGLDHMLDGQAGLPVLPGSTLGPVEEDVGLGQGEPVPEEGVGHLPDVDAPQGDGPPVTELAEPMRNDLVGVHGRRVVDDVEGEEVGDLGVVGELVEAIDVPLDLVGIPGQSVGVHIDKSSSSVIAIEQEIYFHWKSTMISSGKLR